jgi:NADH:quinone reductase (non-electrogenic)
LGPEERSSPDATGGERYNPAMASAVPKVVIVGAGFGGLYAAKALAKLPVELTVIDKKNHHTFQPLLYQVALAVLSPAEIASPIRAVFQSAKNVEVLLGEVEDFDLAGKKVMVKGTGLQLSYDYLIVAAGATHAYFGHEEWAALAPGLKTLEDGVEIRRRVLLAFEAAESMAVAEGKYDPLNFVVVGAGPTGVELAGTLSEIARNVLVNDFRHINPAQARVILLEGGPRVLAAYPEDLSRSAEKQLRDLGVEVRTHAMVTDIAPKHVRVGGEELPAAVTLWAAGVAASPLGKKLAEKSGATTDRAGRVQVGNDLSIPGYPNVFVVGDLAAYPDASGHLVPGVAPAAIQMGLAVAKNIARDLRREARKTFHYRDKGSLATIGRSRAVATVRGLHFSGFIAWLSWALVHIFFLIGFKNRFFVLADWMWAYFSYQRGARLITDRQ